MSRNPKWVVCEDTATFDLSTLIDSQSPGRKRGFCEPATEHPRFFEEESEALEFKCQISGRLLLPVVEVRAKSKTRVLTFREFLPLDEVPVSTAISDSEFVNQEIEDPLTMSPECWLGSSWNFEDIEWKARLGPWHDYSRSSDVNITQILAGCVYDLEDELRLACPAIGADDIVAFFASKQVSDHLWRFAEVFGRSNEAVDRHSGDKIVAQAVTDEARYWLEREIVRYVHLVASLRAQEAAENEAVLRAYMAKFPPPQTVSKSDISLAARQDSSHLSKWLKAGDDFRRGSAADIAFRRLFNQDLRPEEFDCAAF